MALDRTFRGGRCLTVSGVKGKPTLYYMGATGGGIWKTDDAGSTWFPISDTAFHSASVGALADRAERSEYYLCRNGRSGDPQYLCYGRWNV